MIRVLSVAYPFAPVGPNSVGGAEQIVSAIDRAVVGAGEKSIVIAAEGSETAGELLPVPRLTDVMMADRRQTVHAAVRSTIASVLHRADIVHMHGVDFYAYAPPPGKPVLITLHLPPDWYPRRALFPVGARLNCVSESQQKCCPSGVPLLPFIPNGVPVHTLSAARHHCRGYALMLGRICPEKGQHLGLVAAHAAEVSAFVAGEVFTYPDHQSYFSQRVAPLLDRRRRFLGPVGFNRKRRLLAAALCLLVPSVAAETSSLVTMEAMACGTPVIAFRSGALPDLIADGRTGYLVSDDSAMAEAIGRIGAIDRDECRREAARRFSVARMTSAYMQTYRRLIACA